jgi:hypothetical protein
LTRKKFIWLPIELKKTLEQNETDFDLTVEVYLLAQSKACSPTCGSFKCAQNNVFYRRDSVGCRLTEEMCNVSNCTYSMCLKRRLLPGGVCGETVKRKTVEKDLDDDLLGEPIRFKRKALRKLGDREIF